MKREHKTGQLEYYEAYSEATQLKRKSQKYNERGGRLNAEKLKKIKRRRRLITLIICAAVVVIIAVIIAAAIHTKEPEEPEVIIEVPTPEAVRAEVSSIYVYGTYLNMEGTLPKAMSEFPEDAQIELILFDGENTEVYSVIAEEGEFCLAEELNRGLFLDSVPRGTYTMFLRIKSLENMHPEAESETENADVISSLNQAASEASDKVDSAINELIGENETESEEETVYRIEKKKPDETEETAAEAAEETEPETDDEGNVVEPQYYYTYYSLSNKTDYAETVYYTMSNAGNKIVIDSETTYPTMQMTVTANADAGVYDVVLDPGHGGVDPGALSTDQESCERDFTPKLALKIKAILEEAGVKVAMTNSGEETLSVYGSDGRIAKICSSKAKYAISIHMDSGEGTGLEVICAPGIDYSFAELLSANIRTTTGLESGTASADKVADSVYATSLTVSDVESMIAEYESDGLVPYEPLVGTPYHYIVRETGGSATGAFRDDRNPGEKYNIYADSNVGVETYITELGYITDDSNLAIMKTNMDGYATAIANAIITEFNKSEPAENENK